MGKIKKAEARRVCGIRVSNGSLIRNGVKIIRNKKMHPLMLPEFLCYSYVSTEAVQVKY